MWLRQAVLVAVAAGCAGTPTATTFVKRGDEALERGQLAEAEEQYRLAEIETAGMEFGRPWVETKIERGQARIELERMRRDTELYDVKGSPPQILEELLKKRERLAALGGDAAVDAKLAAAVNGVVTLMIQQAGQLDPIVASTQLQQALRIEDLRSELRAQAEPIIARARESLLARSHEREGKYPLSAHAFAYLAVGHGGPRVFYDPAVSTPYLLGVTRHTKGTACGAFNSIPTSEDTDAEATRRIELTIEYETCEDATKLTTQLEQTRRTERQLVRVDYTPTKQQNCFVKTYEPVYTCGAGMTVCALTSPSPEVICSEVTVVQEHPVYADVEVIDERKTVQQRGEFRFAARVTATIDGATTSRDVNTTDAVTGVVESFRGVQTKSSWRSWSTFVARQVAAVEKVQRELIANARSADRARAETKARAAEAEGRLDDADEAWVEVAIYGGELGGRWRELFQDGDALSRGAQLSWKWSDPEPWKAPVRTFTAVAGEPPDDEVDVRSPDSRRYLAALPPIGRSLSFDIGGTALFADGYGAAGVRFAVGAGVLSRTSKPRIGLRLYDAIEGYAAAGAVFDTPEISGSKSMYGVGASYVLGVSYRRLQRGGLILGVRPEAGYASFGTSGTYVGVPAYVRAELASSGQYSVAFEISAPVVGSRHLGGQLLVTKGNPSTTSGFARYVAIGYDQRTLDVDVMGTSSELDVSNASLLLGFGF